MHIDFGKETGNIGGARLPDAERITGTQGQRAAPGGAMGGPKQGELRKRVEAALRALPAAKRTKILEGQKVKVAIQAGGMPGANRVL